MGPYKLRWIDFVLSCSELLQFSVTFTSVWLFCFRQGRLNDASKEVKAHPRPPRRQVRELGFLTFQARALSLKNLKLIFNHFFNQKSL